MSEYPKPQAHEFEGQGFEPEDIGHRVVVIWGISILAFVAVVLAFTYGVFLLFVPPYNAATTPTVYPHGELVRTPPPPVLQTDPAGDMQKYREQEDKMLHSFRALPEAAGKAAIPIDRAIEITAQRGLPTRPGAIDPNPPQEAEPEVVATPPGEPGDVKTSPSEH